MKNDNFLHIGITKRKILNNSVKAILVAWVVMFMKNYKKAYLESEKGIIKTICSQYKKNTIDITGYKFKIMKAAKNILEYGIFLIIIITALWKNNILILYYLPFIFIVLLRGTSISFQIIFQTAFLISLFFQYALLLLNISDSTAPQSKINS